MVRRVSWAEIVLLCRPTASPTVRSAGSTVPETTTMAALRSSLASTTATAAAVGTSGRVFFQSASFASCSSRSSSFASSTSARAQAPAASPPPPPPSWTPAAPSISDLILGSDPAYEFVQHARFSSSDKGKGREVVGSGLDLYHYSTYPPGLPDHDRPTLLVLNSANLVDAALMYLKGCVPSFLRVLCSQQCS